MSDSSSSKMSQQKENRKPKKFTKKLKKQNSDTESNDDRPERPKRFLKNQMSKKDIWIDDEPIEIVVSSCDMDSDDEKTVLAKPLKTSEDEILDLFNNAPISNFKSLVNISQKKWELLNSLKPYSNYSNLCLKLQSEKMSFLLTSAADALNARKLLNNLLEKCQIKSKSVKKKVKSFLKPENEQKDETQAAVSSSSIEYHLIPQPKVLSNTMQLKPYQIIGMNWLILMHKEKLNSVLADEMGLGKTCQTIAFLAYLHEQNHRLVHLIVVPSSTLDNWARELSLWFPNLNFYIYNGTLTERADKRREISQKINRKQLNVILSTYSFVSSQDADRLFFRRLKLEYCVYDEAHMLKNMKSLKYTNLMQIKSKRRLLLTGTPLQNNVTELLSLLGFVTPDIFLKHIKILNKLFQPKSQNTDIHLDVYHKEKILQLRGIMDSFVLRRLKLQVLRDLPEKKNNLVLCEMTSRQSVYYQNLLNELRRLRDEQHVQIQLESKMSKLRTNPYNIIMNESQKRERKQVIRFQDDFFNDELDKEPFQVPEIEVISSDQSSFSSQQSNNTVIELIEFDQIQNKGDNELANHGEVSQQASSTFNENNEIIEIDDQIESNAKLIDCSEIVSDMDVTTSKSLLAEPEDREAFSNNEVQSNMDVVFPIPREPLNCAQTSECLIEPMEQDVKSTDTDKIKYKSSFILKAILNMRSVSNHILLRRTIYDDKKIEEMAKIIVKEKQENTVFKYVVEDMSVMNDFELHNLCSFYQGLREYKLATEVILDSGKFRQMDKLLAEFKRSGDRVLVFSQFKIMLNIIEAYLNIRKYPFVRLDGTTKVSERQGLIDKYNTNKKIFVFLLTTKAGGVGINLTGANKVIIHDIDFNPQNDKQAEDRCHRVGQMKQVDVYKLVSQDTIEEKIVELQVNKLQLDEDISNSRDVNIASKATYLTALKNILG